MQADAKILLEVADGPEMIRLYTSEEASIIDWAADIPGLYLEASTADAYIKLGPFCLKTIRKGIEAAFRSEVS